MDDTIVRAVIPDLAAPASDPTLAPLTARYAFRVGRDGRVVLLDEVCLVGRAPKPSRIPGAATPKLIRVPSPGGEVSATHLEIRQHGSSVIVTDLRSTNGSRVSVPGSSTRFLRQGESMVVTPGTLVDVGDGTVVEILPLQRQLGGYGYV
jgi:hypothetical protein